MIPVEVIEFPDGKVVACGEILESKVKEWAAEGINLPLGEDGVMRISNLLWDFMKPEARQAFLMNFGCEPK